MLGLKKSPQVCYNYSWGWVSKKMKTPETKEKKALADRVVQTMGSWRFIIIQSIFLALWMAFNTIGHAYHWDEYPFVFMNLMLSMQAAYAAPIILMSQNRQVENDRRQANLAYILTQQTGSNVHTVIEEIKDLAEKLEELGDTFEDKTKVVDEDTTGLAQAKE